MTEQTQPLLTDALARLRHLYSNLMNGGVRDTASAKRIAEGLLSPVIADLEKWGTPAPVGVEPVALLVRKNSWRDGQWEAAPPNSPSYGLTWANQRVYVYTTPQPDFDDDTTATEARP